MNRSSFFLLLFAVVCAAELTSVVLDLTLVERVSKPLIMLSLAAYFISLSPGRQTTFMLALAFCWAGDVLLLLQGETTLFFMLGLVAFLFGHIAYIFSYRTFQYADRSRELLSTQKARYSFPVILIGTGLYTILFPHLGELKIPVLAYSSVLVLMVMTAIFRYGRTPSSSFWLIFYGAALFMLSDSLLAINKFYTAFPLSRLLIMSTYIAAQYLIVKGALAHLAENPSPK